MINIMEFTKFVNQKELELSAEEAFLILAIEENNGSQAYKLEFNKYFGRNKDRFKYKVLIEQLIAKGFLRNLGELEAPVKLSNLIVTEKFRGALMVDLKVAYLQAKALYPKKMYITDLITRVGTEMGTFANLEEDMEAYNKYVLKGNLKVNHLKFIETMTGFQHDPTVFPKGLAKMKWSTFCKNWDGFLDMQSEVSAYSRRSING